MNAADAHLLGFRAVEPLEVVVGEEEGLGDRLDELVLILRHGIGLAGGLPKNESWKWWGNLTPYKRAEFMRCAIRELDGQRHALREEVESANAYARLTGEGKLAAQEGRDAAIRRAEEAEAELEGYVAGFAALSLDYREGEADRARLRSQLDALRAMWRRAAGSAVAQRRWAEGWGSQLARTIDEKAELKAENGSLRARVDELEALTSKPTTEAQNDTAIHPEPFEAWHARECPGRASGYGCARTKWAERSSINSSWYLRFADRFAGRSCHDVYEAEVLSRGNAGKGAAA